MVPSDLIRNALLASPIAPMPSSVWVDDRSQLPFDAGRFALGRSSSSDAASALSSDAGKICWSSADMQLPVFMLKSIGMSCAPFVSSGCDVARGGDLHWLAIVLLGFALTCD